MNTSNLIPANKRSPEQVREMGRKGGLKSGEVRRRNADLLGCIESKLLEQGVDGVSRDEKIADVLIGLAEGGDITAIKVLLDRLHGKVTDKIAVSGNGQHIVNVRFCKTDEEVEKWK